MQRFTDTAILQINRARPLTLKRSTKSYASNTIFCRNTDIGIFGGLRTNENGNGYGVPRPGCY